MLFFTKNIIVTQHAKRRYIERVSKISLSSRKVREMILKDFQVKSVRRKTPKAENGEFKLWVHGSRLYVCIEKEKTIIVKTVIQMLPEDEKRIKEEIENSNL